MATLLAKGTTRFQPYPEYRDSGVEWLGEIPASWELKPLWTLFRRIKRTGYPEEELLSVYRDYGVIPKTSRDDNFNRPSEDLSSYQLVHPRDLVMNKMKTWQGSIAISMIRGIVSPAYYIYSPQHSEHDRYLHYLLRSPVYVAGYQQRSKGVRINQWDLEPDAFSRMKVLLPDRKEQQAIADFLDRETAKIDALIEKKKKLIELLEEKRTALITSAVTKGLDPNVPMKDSGVEWLGEIPAHWRSTKIKFLTTRIVDGVHSTPEYVPEGIPFITVKNLTAVPEGISFDDVKYITPAAHQELLRRANPEQGDILLTKDGTLGVPRVVDTDRSFSIFVSVALLKLVRSMVDPWFIRFALEATPTIEQFRARTLGSALTHLHLGQIANVYISVPTLAEQRRLVRTLSNRLKELSETRNLIDVAIERLQEYRTALISAAVTGKIDVRETATAREAAS